MSCAVSAFEHFPLRTYAAIWFNNVETNTLIRKKKRSDVGMEFIREAGVHVAPSPDRATLMAGVAEPD